jgi:hypothetical protein
MHRNSSAGLLPEFTMISLSLLLLLIIVSRCLSLQRLIICIIADVNGAVREYYYAFHLHGSERQSRIALAEPGV